MKDTVIDFPLGESYPGTNASGTLINSALEGRTYEFAVTEEVAEAMNMSKRTVGRRVTARIFRNIVGAPLLPGTIVTIDQTAGIEGTGQASALAGVGEHVAYVVDPALPAAGVADDDLFLGIVRGPTTVKLVAAGVNITGGGPAKAAASGLATAGVIGTDDDILLLGTFLATSSSGSNGSTLQPIDWCPRVS